MHETITDGKIEFFWSNFIYKSLHLELQINFYEFLKFATFSGISYIRINPEKDLLRQPGVSVTSAVNWDGPGQPWPVGPVCQCQLTN